MSRWVKGLAAAAALCAVVGPGTAAQAAGDPTITLPKLPSTTQRNITVDPAEIARRAAEVPAPAPGTDPGEASASFFYGDLAMSSFDDLCSATPTELKTLLGNIQVSGYFGGVWFRDQVPGLQVRNAALTPLLGKFSRGTVGGVDAAAGQLLRVARGPADRLRSANSGALGALLFIQGYNQGYLQIVVEHPPKGVTLPPGYVRFEDLLRNPSQRYQLGIRAELEPVLTKLRAAATPGWASMEQRADTLGGLFVKSGRATWTAILRGGPLQGASYRSVLDLSTGFLQVTEASTLAAMAAAVDGDVALGRCSFALQAGLTVWAGSYFAGLASELPAGSYPVVTWP